MLFALLSLVLAVPAWAHGGSYRGPNGGVPPGGREPSDPEPPPPPPSDPGDPGGPSTPSEPDRGPDTPHDPGGTTPGNTPQPPGPPKPPNDGRRGPRTPTLTFESWRYWWAYNNAPILNIKSHILETPITSSDPLYHVHNRDKGNRVDARRPTRAAIQRRVIPALVRILERRGEIDDVVGGAAIALAKAGHSPFITRYGEMIDGTMITSKGKKLKFGPQTTESAVLSLGLLPDLDAGLKASVRKICLEAISNTKLRRRDRAWAAVSLGFQRDVEALQSLMDLLKERYADPNIPCGIIAGIGLMGPAAKDALPEFQSALEGGVLMGRNIRNEDRIRAFCGYAIAKIGDVSSLPLIHKLLRSRGTGRVVKRSAAIAAGVLGRKADADMKKATVAALNYYLRTAKGDASGINFAIISLSQIGTDPAIKKLLDIAENGRYGQRPFAALGLATMVWYRDRDARAGTAEPMDADRRARIVNKFIKLSNKFKDSDTRSAFLLARGLVQDRSAVTELVKIAAKRSGNATLRGYACQSLGLLGVANRDVKDALKLALAERKSDDLRRSAATGLGLLKDADVLSFLIKELKRAKSFAVQGQLIQAIGTIGDYRAVGALIELLEDRSQPAQARAMAAVGLGMISDLQELPTLSRLSTDYNYRASVKDIDELLFIL